MEDTAAKGTPPLVRLWTAKLSAPQLPSDSVFRTRILAQLAEDATPVVMVLAPAGFGKTMVMRQLFDQCRAQGTAVAWLSLNARDNDLRCFLDYLSAALSELVPFSDTSPHAPGPARPLGERREDAAGLLDAVAASSTPFTLFLDEFECLTSAEVLRIIQDLAGALNIGQRVVIGSRSMNAMPLTSLTVRGRVKTIQADDLRFDTQETATFFSLQGKFTLSEHDVSLVGRRVEGWAAGLRLVSLALPSVPDQHDWLERLSGRTDGFAEYLAENVLARLGERDRGFMLRASALDRLNGDLCDEVLDRSDSGLILDDIRRANLFLTPIGNDLAWFRFHPLFHAFLRDQLRRVDPAAFGELNRRAALWYLREQRYVPAVDHALASGDHRLAADIIDQCAMDFVAASQLETVASWVDALPPEATADKEKLQHARFYVMTALHRSDEARDALMKLREIAARQGRETEPQVDVQMALLNAWTDRYELIEAELAKTIDRITSGDSLLFGIKQNVKAGLSILGGKFDEARQALSSAKTAYQRLQLGLWSFTFTLCFEGVIDMIQGQVREATERFELAFRHAEGAGLEVASSYLAEALYERNELERASLLAEENLRRLRNGGTPDTIIVGFRTAARAAFLKGRTDIAESILSELGDIGDMRALTRLKVAAWLEKSRLALLAGDSEIASRFARLAVNNHCWRQQRVSVRYPHEIDDPDIAAIRIDLVTGKAEDAAAKLEQAVKEADRSMRDWRKLRLKVLLAQAYACTRRRGQALRQLEEALLAGSRNGLIHVFADEPWFLPDLLDELAEQSPHINSKYLGQVRDATRRLAYRHDQLVVERANTPLLSLKEREVMQRVAEGLSNKEIAHLLAISDTTVETHLRRINQKLGTKKRTAAIAKLRELGILR